MKKSLLIAHLLLAGSVFGQFNQGNEPTVGLNQSMFLCDSFAPNYSAITGTGVTWDYSTIAAEGTITKSINVVDPATLPNGVNYPTSTRAIVIQDFITSYFNSSSASRISQGFTFTEATLGNINAVFNVDEQLLMNYPFAFPNSIIDPYSGEVRTTAFGTFPTSGIINATVDGTGTILLNSTTSIPNITRYKIIDSLAANAGPFGTVTLQRVQYEYYDLSNSALPVFVHAKLTITLGGTPQILNLVLNIAQPDGFVGISEDELTSVSVYPNPATDLVTINGLETEGMATISTLNGQIVQTNTVGKGTQTLSIESLPSGIYMISIETTNGKATHRLVVE